MIFEAYNQYHTAIVMAKVNFKRSLDKLVGKTITVKCMNLCYGAHSFAYRDGQPTQQDGCVTMRVMEASYAWMTDTVTITGMDLENVMVVIDGNVIEEACIQEVIG